MKGQRRKRGRNAFFPREGVEKCLFAVIPAKAGIPEYLKQQDSCLRRNDGKVEILHLATPSSGEKLRTRGNFRSTLARVYLDVKGPTGMEKPANGQGRGVRDISGRFVRILSVCLFAACVLMGTVERAAAGNAGNREIAGQRTPVFHVPEENRTIYEIAPRSYHRKGEELVRATGKRCCDCHEAEYYPQHDFFGWEYQKKWVLHWWMFSLSMLIMLPGIYSAVLLWRRGRSPSLHYPVHWPSVARAMVKDVLLGERIRRQSVLRWAVFQLISVAFLALSIVFALIVVQRFLLPMAGVSADRAGLFLEFSADFLGGCILAGIFLAFIRRIAGRGGHVKTEGEDILVLFLLLGIVTTGFFLEACRLAVVDPQPRIWASFLGAAGAEVLRMWDLPWTDIRFYVWIFHAGLVFTFFAYLPFSKLFHIMTSPVSILATASEAHYKQRQ